MKVLTLDSGRDTLSEIKIRELSSDPVSVDGEVWVRKTVTIGTPIGLLLTLTNTITKYELSFKASGGAIVRTEMK